MDFHHFRAPQEGGRRASAGRANFVVEEPGRIALATGDGRHCPGKRHKVELRLQEISQLFNSMDPTPFHHKDLDADAEEFIESWALEFPPGGEYQVTIHLEHTPAGGDPT